MAEVRVDGLDIDVVEEGDGEPVLLVHGSASDRRTWDAQRPLLSDRFRVVTYSRRYHWPNPPAAADAVYSMGFDPNNIRAEYVSESFDPLTAEEVVSVSVPTLLVSGADSPRLWSLLADQLHDLLPNSTRLVVPNASHIVHEDNPAALGREIHSFLGSA